MKLLLATLLYLTGVAAAAEDSRAMLIVVSEPGNPTYDLEFQRQAKAWQDLAAKGGFEVKTLGLGETPADGDRPVLEETLGSLPKSGGDLWLVWIGHGSDDGRTANFNLRGPDIDAKTLARLLEPFERRLVLLHLFSASGPFLTSLSKPNRVIVSATRGSQKNYSRFGEKLADALASPDADLDLDGSLSLLEATLHAAGTTKAFYEDAQRVVQENAILDDNGDGRPTSLDAFQGLRATGPAADGGLAREIHFLKANADPLPPEAREKRAELEAAIDALRQRKSELEEDAYYAELEKLLRQMAKLYRQPK
jgi:hypothetical protein